MAESERRYVAVGRWAGMSQDEIEAEIANAETDADEQQSPPS
jgi:hypothetical protein